MRIVMTMMVRDEADIIVPALEHHLDQGVDLIMVTDNGSVDGTTQILERYVATGKVELHQDPVHEMQQGTLVTGMARRACTEHGADWVINGDADEFLVPLDRSLSVRGALERTPVALKAFTVPVVNLVGPPAGRGSGIDRLSWRDLRTYEQLELVGIHAQPTPNAIHVGDPDVRVSEGNHFVSLESQGQPEPAIAMEVLHLPWRSWSQFERKVIKAGAAFEASSDLQPSPKHHGMADYRRALAGRLLETFLLRLPSDFELDTDDAFVEDDWLAQYLHGLVPRALCPDLLVEALDASSDRPYSLAERAAGAATGAKFIALEAERDGHLYEAAELRSALRSERQSHQTEVEGLRASIESERADRRAEVGGLRDALVESEQRVRRLRRQRNQARQEIARLTAWVPLRDDLSRVSQRLACALLRRVTPD